MQHFWLLYCCFASPTNICELNLIIINASEVFPHLLYYILLEAVIEINIFMYIQNSF